MKKNFCGLLFILILFSSVAVNAQQNKNNLSRSIRSFGVLPENSASLNKTNLQKAIDWATNSGATLFVEPSEKPYEVSGGIVLKKNVSLIGVHGPVPRGTKHPTLKQPVGSVFSIKDTTSVFITVESSTQIKGIQFWYPEQSIKEPLKIIAYPPTIQVSQSMGAEGVTLSNLTFYGEFLAMDFNANQQHPCGIDLYRTLLWISFRRGIYTN